MYSVNITIKKSLVLNNMKRKKKDSPRAQMTCLTLFGPVLVVPSPPASDGQGFWKPHGYMGMGAEGKGQGS